MIKVVVVDDEILLRKGLISTTPWSSLDCEVVGEASDADEGEEVIKNLQPDIVIMDIKMPGRTGLELIKSLKSEAGCEFIILSGYGEFSYAQKAIDLGVNSYLLKPVGDEELLEAIRKTVALVKEKAFYKKVKLEYDKQRPVENMFTAAGEGGNSEKYLQKALQYIKEHCGQADLVIKDVADHLQISSSYLWKLFGKKTTYSFNEYLTLCRIKKAITLLSDEHMKVYEIAEACGYKDIHYFSSVFKKIIGMTPTEYRELKL